MTFAVPENASKRMNKRLRITMVMGCAVADPDAVLQKDKGVAMFSGIELYGCVCEADSVTRVYFPAQSPIVVAPSISLAPSAAAGSHAVAPVVVASPAVGQTSVQAPAPSAAPSS